MMEIEQSRPLTMVLQEGRCSFGVLKNYEEHDDKFSSTVEVKAGTLMTGDVYTVILQPYRLEYGNPPSAS